MKADQRKLGSLLSYSQMFLSILIGMLYTPVMIRLLGKSEYGLYNTVASTISMLSNVVFLSLGNAVGILMGQMLGAGLPEEQVRRDNKRMIRLCVMVCFGVGAVTIGMAGFFTKLYNTTEAVRSIAVGLICLTAVMMPVNSYTNAMYFTLRSGGQTFITFIFDSGFSWCICVPVAFILSRFTDLPILPLYGICVGVDVFKIIIGKKLLDKGVWIRRIVD